MGCSFGCTYRLVDADSYVLCKILTFQGERVFAEKCDIARKAKTFVDDILTFEDLMWYIFLGLGVYMSVNIQLFYV